MSATLNTELHVPDLWYDFYARFLPGVTFIGLLRVIAFPQKPTPDTNEMIILVFMGYVSALITQPIASRTTGLIEGQIESIFVPSSKGGENRIDLVRKVQRKLGPESNEAFILGKMHAEETFFVQLAVLSLFLLFILLIMCPYWWPMTYCHLGFSILMLGGAIEVACRRFERAQRLENAITQ